MDPFSKDIGLRPPQGKADMVLITHNHDDHNNAAALKEDPLLIDGPGEYEIKGIDITGIPAFHDKKNGAERGQVTLYKIEVEDISILHLADFGQDKLTDEQLEKIGDVDVLMIPVGGVYTIDSEEAVKIINQIEPRIVVPMHYKIQGLTIKLDPIEKFLKSMGAGHKEPVEKLALKKKELGGEEMEIVVMKAM